MPISRARTTKLLDKARKVCALVEDVFPKLADKPRRCPDDQRRPAFDIPPHGAPRKTTSTRTSRRSFPTTTIHCRTIGALLDRYALKDKAIKVVGVGSVGTLCSIALLMASEKDPLFLQVKEARPSVLETYAGRSLYPNHGQRVVKGHRLMQSASDIFLGWTQDSSGRHFYVRQLRDMKLKFPVEVFKPAKMVIFAGWCGATLARAHARSGEPALISGYLGKSDAFDRAIAAFAVTYADQVERDYEIFAKAVAEGKFEARGDDSSRSVTAQRTHPSP